MAVVLAAGLCFVARADAYVYWTNEGSGTIGHANLDATGANQSFITGADNPYGIAVDAQHIYWANNGAGTIGRASLDGTGADESFITGAHGVNGVAVDGRHIYWASEASHAIGRATWIARGPPTWSSSPASTSRPGWRSIPARWGWRARARPDWRSAPGPTASTARRGRCG